MTVRKLFGPWGRLAYFAVGVAGGSCRRQLRSQLMAEATQCENRSLFTAYVLCWPHGDGIGDAPWPPVLRMALHDLRGRA